jgi:hypothetical protein
MLKMMKKWPKLAGMCVLYVTLDATLSILAASIRDSGAAAADRAAGWAPPTSTK